MIFICDKKNWPTYNAKCSSMAVHILECPFCTMNSIQQSSFIKQNDRCQYSLDQGQSPNVQVHKAFVEDKVITILCYIKIFVLSQVQIWNDFLSAEEFAFS